MGPSILFVVSVVWFRGKNWVLLRSYPGYAVAEKLSPMSSLYITLCNQACKFSVQPQLMGPHMHIIWHLTTRGSIKTTIYRMSIIHRYRIQILNYCHSVCSFQLFRGITSSKRGNFHLRVIFVFFVLLSSSRKLPPHENKTHMPLWRK